MLVLRYCTLVILLAVSQTSLGADNPAHLQVEPKICKYGDLLKRVQQGDTTVDFVEFRLAYTKTGQYKPYRNDLDETRSEMRSDSEFELYSRALDGAQKILNKQYVDIEAHLVCARAYAGLGDSTRQQFHQYVANRLITSVLRSGDGESPDSAFVVILIPEEYAILKGVFGYKIELQSLVSDSAGTWDVFGVIDSAGLAKDVYFNIGIPFRKLKWKF